MVKGGLKMAVDKNSWYVSWSTYIQVCSLSRQEAESVHLCTRVKGGKPLPFYFMRCQIERTPAARWKWMINILEKKKINFTQIFLHCTAAARFDWQLEHCGNRTQHVNPYENERWYGVWNTAVVTDGNRAWCSYIPNIPVGILTQVKGRLVLDWAVDSIHPERQSEREREKKVNSSEQVVYMKRASSGVLCSRSCTLKMF